MRFQKSNQVNFIERRKCKIRVEAIDLYLRNCVRYRLFFSEFAINTQYAVSQHLRFVYTSYQSVFKVFVDTGDHIVCPYIAERDQDSALLRFDRRRCGYGTKCHQLDGKRQQHCFVRNSWAFVHHVFGRFGN